MDAWVLDWINLAFRWIHVIVGIAWIGSSFFFIWLENHLRPPRDGDASVHGDLWLVHGGGFYHMKKFKSVPDAREDLHWFKWEAYATWVSGFVLLAVIYYAGASSYLIGAQSTMTPWMAIALGISSLVLSWLVYDALCRSPLGKDNRALAIAGIVLAVLLAWALTRVFSGRGAFIHFGACLGTIMAANVFMRIIPTQRRMLAAAERGETVDPSAGKKAGQRSLHNNYLTLPVIFTMVSNHYPLTYGPDGNWLILLALAAIGGAVRHAFNRRNQGRPLSWLLPASAIALMMLAYVASPATRSNGSLADGDVEIAEASRMGDFAIVQAVVAGRCSSCHAARPTNPDFDAPPAGVMFDQPEQIVQWAPRIKARTIDSHDMPLGNLTGMREEERAILANWIANGASGPEALPAKAP